MASGSAEDHIDLSNLTSRVRFSSGEQFTPDDKKETRNVSKFDQHSHKAF